MGEKVEVGQLVSAVMEAVNRSSPELLKGRRGITSGMLVPPTVDARDEMRPDESYIPKPALDKLDESLGAGFAKQLDAFASKAGAIMVDMRTQRSAMTLPNTRMAESLATLRRLHLITSAESEHLEKLVALNDQNCPIPKEYSLMFTTGRLSPLFKAILSCALAAEKVPVSPLAENRQDSEGEGPFNVGACISNAANIGQVVGIGVGGVLGAAALLGPLSAAAVPLGAVFTAAATLGACIVSGSGWSSMGGPMGKEIGGEAVTVTQ